MHVDHITTETPRGTVVHDGGTPDGRFVGVSPQGVLWVAWAGGRSTEAFEAHYQLMCSKYDEAFSAVNAAAKDARERLPAGFRRLEMEDE